MQQVPHSLKVFWYNFRLTEAVKGGWYDKVQTVLNLAGSSAAGEYIYMYNILGCLLDLANVQ